MQFSTFHRIPDGLWGISAVHFYSSGGSGLISLFGRVNSLPDAGTEVTYSLSVQWFVFRVSSGKWWLVSSFSLSFK